MRREDCRVGMVVLFGRENGEQTLGEVIKLNLRSAKVKTLEARGYGRGGKPGTKWRVDYGLMQLAPAHLQKQTTPAAPVSPAQQTPTYSVTPAVTEVDELGTWEVRHVSDQTFATAIAQNIVASGQTFSCECYVDQDGRRKWKISVLVEAK